MGQYIKRLKEQPKTTYTRTFVKTIITNVYFQIGVNIIGLPDIHAHQVKFETRYQLPN